MKISLNWLRDYVEVSLEPRALGDRLTMSGLEVSSVDSFGQDIGDVAVGQILEQGPHPNADRLSLCKVTDGSETYDIVCGASNMAPGDKVALAKVGARLAGGVVIKKSKIRGQPSFGMMCSEDELGIGEDHAGILILPSDAPVGARLAQVLGLPDAVLGVDLTPNRGDCLSVVGIAREVAALTGGRLRTPEPTVPERGRPVQEETSVEILAPDLCHRYAARVVRGVTLGPSPLWLRQRLRVSGVRSINNVVDVTNYVLLELGHPLHAFDYRRLAGGRIVVRRAGIGEVFATLDGKQRTLDSDMLVICDGERPVALAGIMGGLNSEVQDDTVDLLLESAYFLPSNIRLTSKRLGLQTEASYRFERGTDIEGLVRALDRAAELIVELAGGTVARGIWDAYPTRRDRRRVALRFGKVASVLGIEIPENEVARHLHALGIRELSRTAVAMEAEIPPHRVDLEREIDLIEEVARIKGYEEIPTTLPTVPMVCDPLPKTLAVAETARDALAALGFREAVCLSFGDPADDERIGYEKDSPLRQKVTIENPLSRETAVLRTSLLPGLLRSAGLNARRQNRDVRLFEVGRTYHPSTGGRLPREIHRAGGIQTGRRDPLTWWAAGDAVDYYDGKGAIEWLLERLRVPGARFRGVSDLPWLHPGRAAQILLGEEVAGWVGEIRSDRLEPYEIAPPAVGFEIDLELADRYSSQPGVFPGLDRFPPVERDLALLVDQGVPAQAVLDAIAAFDSPLLRSVVLFDAFEGGPIPEGKTSLAFRITCRAEERTLTEEEVYELEGGLLKQLEERVGARRRGA